MKLLRYFFVLLGILGLVGVRYVEADVFYDPLLAYFKESTTQSQFPEIKWMPLIGSHLLRFLLNVLFSVAVLQGLFANKIWTIQGIVLMMIFFAITFPLYLYCVYTQFSIGELFSFYIRRFVIQPLALLLIIPLFYYRKSIEKK